MCDEWEGGFEQVFVTRHWNSGGYFDAMTVTLPLNQMTSAEKLNLIQDIWENLDKDTDETPFPAWHAEVLNEREKRIAAGEETFLEWEDAKKLLDKRFA